MERRPDIVIVHKMKKTAVIIDLAMPLDKRIIDKKKEKIEKYQKLKREILRLWTFKKIDVIPVVLVALGSATNNYVDKIGTKVDLDAVPNTTFLGTARLLRKVLEC